MKRVERILVPLDHSAGSDDIVQYACAVARGLTASITLVHIYEPPNAMVAIVAGATRGGEADAERAAGVALLDRAAAILQANGFTTSERILERFPRASDAIVRHVQSGKFDLIVMGTHARRGVSRVVLGSVAEDVVRSVRCPVMMVHLPQD
ncbi:MAG TPA: universal stress protein [Kofleriaceae bacterium]|nr:universal stress protein [Kofleriaceae bacterium]